jgi:formate-dependent nitrite reductase membrane component NrfD
MMLREVDIGWGWEVYVEMFLAGIAAGAYLIAMILELFGRGRSPIARAAHTISLPLVVAATVLLISKLERPERFWHMVIQSENIPRPMFKWWAPISLGTWALIAFTGFTGVSLIDAIIDRGWLRLGPWRRGRTLHGSRIVGKLWALAAIPVALFVAGYSGALLSVTAVRGWVDTVFIGPFFIALSAATGVAALLLIEAFRRRSAPEEVAGLERAGTLFLLWQFALLIVFAISLGGALGFFFSSLRTIAAIVIGLALAIVALLLLQHRVVRSPGWRLGLAASLVLISGFLFRYFVVMGPQHAIT